jgi:acetyltransferase-like isoleucine patch superfamily enzyme
MEILRKVSRFINYLATLALAFPLALVMYDRKWLRSKYFKSKYGYIGASGWNWVLYDAWGRFFLGANKGVRFPVSPRIKVSGYRNIQFSPDDLMVFQGVGNYFQSFGTGKIIIGRGVYIAQNVGIITMNHDVNDPDLHVQAKDVVIGEKCWIGMNAMILPGVVLGDKTTVGAGSVVTKSFTEGNCIVAGNPAKLIT